MKLIKSEKVNNAAIIILVFLLAMFAGNFSSNLFSNKTDRIEKVFEIKRDTLPLENGGEIALELIGNEKSVYISYEDLKYISKKRIRTVVKNIDALFLRMKE